jgi:hypothetical protein
MYDALQVSAPARRQMLNLLAQFTDPAAERVEFSRCPGGRFRARFARAWWTRSPLLGFALACHLEYPYTQFHRTTARLRKGSGRPAVFHIAVAFEGSIDW